MYRCNNCGNLFEIGEEAHWVDTHGFADGKGEQMSGCPLCKGDFSETTPCKSCGSERFTEDEMESCICEDCIVNYSKNFDFCVKLGEKETENIKINGAIASLFSEKEINDILIEAAKKIENVSFEKFAEEDKGWFAQMIEDEVER